MLKRTLIVMLIAGFVLAEGASHAGRLGRALGRAATRSAVRSMTRPKPQAAPADEAQTEEEQEEAGDATPAATTPAPAVSEAMTKKIAEDMVDALGRNDLAFVHQRLAGPAQQQLPLNKLTQVWQQTTTQFGPFQKRLTTVAQSTDQAGMKIEVVKVSMQMAKAPLDVVIAFMPDMKVAAIQIVPAVAAAPGARQIASDELAGEAKKIVENFNKGDVNSVFARFDPTMQTQVPLPKMTEMKKMLDTQLGTVKAIEGVYMETVPAGMQGRCVTFACEKGKLDAIVVFNAQRQVSGLQIVPARQAAAAAQAAEGQYVEKDVIVGQGEWALRGTLTLPEGAGPFPAVVLVHGSGPHDRDETIGQNKPFRDLSWGLAAKGIAVLRYEKRTREHALKCVACEKPMTVKEETIDDVSAAVATLKEIKEIDPGKIVIAGHSLGGMLIPRIAKAVPAAAGYVILAGTTRPLEDVMLEQVTYLASLDAAPARQKDARIQKVKEQVELIKSLKAGEPCNEILILGASPQYWLDLKNYNPAEEAKAITQPLLIMQGGRDYQVTMDDYQGWRKALEGRPNVALKNYSDLNHLFITGNNAKSTPSEYSRPGYVAPVVVNDLADWIKKL